MGTAATVRLEFPSPLAPSRPARRAFEDSRRMFCATTDQDAALGWAYQKGLRLGFDRLLVWEVEPDGLEVDINLHPNRWSVPVTNVMAPTGRFLRIVQDVAQADYTEQYLAKNPFGYSCHAKLRCFIPGIIVSNSPVAVRGVGERGQLGPPAEKEQS